MDKMKKTARGLDVFFKILQGLVIAGLIMLAVFDAIAMTLGLDKIVDVAGLNTSVRVGNVVIPPEQIVPMLGELRRSFFIASLFGAASLITVWVGLRIIRQILAPIKEGEPFRSGTADTVAKLGRFTIASGIILSLCSELATGVVYRALIKHFAPDTPYSITYRMDLTFILIAFIIFLVSHVFRYGEELKRRADEAADVSAPEYTA